MIIRQAKITDIDALLEAEQANGETIEEYDADLYRYYIQDPTTTVLVGLDNKNKIMGVVIFDSEHNVIYHLFTIPEVRKNGIGAKLLESALATLDLNDCATSLDVDRGNSKAISLYTKFGFSVKPSDKSTEERLSFVRQPFSHLNL